MTFGKTALRCWLPAAALLLALLCPLPVAAARAGTAIPVSVRTDGAAADAVYTVELTPLDAAPAPVQCALTVKNGGTVYFTGFAFDEPGDYRYLVAERSRGGWHTDREGCRPGGAAANRGRLPHRSAGRRVLRKRHRVWHGVEKEVNRERQPPPTAKGEGCRPPLPLSCVTHLWHPVGAGHARPSTLPLPPMYLLPLRPDSPPAPP